MSEQMLIGTPDIKGAAHERVIRQQRKAEFNDTFLVSSSSTLRISRFASARHSGSGNMEEDKSPFEKTDSFKQQRVQCVCGRGLQAAGEELCLRCLEEEKTEKHQGKVYRMMQCNTKLKKYWLSLEGQELFTYRREEDMDPKQSLFLKNVQLREEACISVDKAPVYSFSLFHTLKKRRYYVSTEEERGWR